MATKRETLDDWFTVKKKSSRKSVGNKEMEANQRAVSAVASIISSDECEDECHCQLDKRRLCSTTEAIYSCMLILS